MTTLLFAQNPYQRECSACITHIEHDADGKPVGVVLDQTVFYPLGGGQAGDAGWLELPDGEHLAIADTRKAKNAAGELTGGVLHVFSSDMTHLSTDLLNSLLQNLINSNSPVTAKIDWERRHKHMRFHTTTHLLCHLVPALVDGCSITAQHARMDFHMTDPLDKDTLNAGLAALVAAALPVQIGQVTDADLDKNPALVKSMSVQPPRGSGVVRTIQIGGDSLVDLQPCGGTHVANTAEIGPVVVTKIEKKSATTRRVVLGFGV